MIDPPTHILFATDFSGRCDRPLERALRLARLWRSELILLHVLESPRAELTDDEQRAEEVRIANKLRSEVGDESLSITTRIENGPVAETIARVAKDVVADLIVTGMAGYDELGDYVVGTTVDRIVRRSHVPVLVVKERAGSDYRSILVATDFSNSSATAFETAASFFPEAALNLAHAYEVRFAPILGKEAYAPAVQAEIAFELDEFLTQLHMPPEVRDQIDFHVDYGETRQVINDLVKTLEIDLAVIGTHGRSGFVAAIIGSNAKALLDSLTCDVMLVPDDML